MNSSTSKKFVNGQQNMKFGNVFCCANFPIYGSTLALTALISAPALTSNSITSQLLLLAAR